jgi:hypothetical protein
MLTLLNQPTHTIKLQALPLISTVAS